MKLTWKKTVDTELKNIMARVKTAQEQLESAVNSKWVPEARRFARRQSKEVMRGLGVIQKVVVEQRKEIDTLIAEIRKNPRGRVRVKLTPKGIKVVQLKKETSVGAKKASVVRAKSKKPAAQVAQPTASTVSVEAAETSQVRPE